MIAFAEAGDADRGVQKFLCKQRKFEIIMVILGFADKNFFATVPRKLLEGDQLVLVSELEDIKMNGFSDEV